PEIRPPRSFKWSFAIACVMSLRLLSGAAEKEFRAGAAKADITPWMGLSIAGNMHDHRGTNIHDQLHARCVVLDDGETRLAIVVADSCMIPRPIFDAAKKLVHERNGLPLEHILMAATHTHSAPAATGIFQSEPDPDYQAFLTRQ